MTEATDAADRFETALGDAGQAATAAGAAAGAATAAATPATEAAATGRKAATTALSDHASKARAIGGDIGQSLVGAVRSAESAAGDFAKTAKLTVRDLVASLPRRSCAAGRPADHARPNRQCAVGRIRRRGWAIRECPACGRRRRRIRLSLTNGSGDGLRRSAANACRWRGETAPRRGAGDPAARRAGSLPT